MKERVIVIVNGGDEYHHPDFRVVSLDDGQVIEQYVWPLPSIGFDPCDVPQEVIRHAEKHTEYDVSGIGDVITLSEEYAISGDVFRFNEKHGFTDNDERVMFVEDLGVMSKFHKKYIVLKKVHVRPTEEEKEKYRKVHQDYETPEYIRFATRECDKYVVVFSKPANEYDKGAAFFASIQNDAARTLIRDWYEENQLVSHHASLPIIINELFADRYDVVNVI